MSDPVKIEITVQPETAEALKTQKQLEAVGRLIDRLFRHEETDDPLLALFERTSLEAQAAGLTDEMIEEELAAHKRERRF